MEFLRSSLRRNLAQKPVVASPNVGCFLRLHIKSPSIAHKLAMALAMQKAGKDATANKQHYKVERS